MIRERQKLTDGYGLLLPAAAPLKVLRGDSEGCIGLSGPVPAMPGISPPEVLHFEMEQPLPLPPVFALA